MHNPHTYAPTDADEARESDRFGKLLALSKAKSLADALETEMLSAESNGALASQKQDDIDEAIAALTDIIQPLIGLATMGLEDEL